MRRLDLYYEVREVGGKLRLETIDFREAKNFADIVYRKGRVVCRVSEVSREGRT